MIHHKQQLIRFLEQNVTDRVLQNALHRGVVEFLGGFRPLLDDIPGWVVRLTSYHGMIYNIGIIEKTGKLYWFRLVDAPWQSWDGDRTKKKLYKGDNPETYQKLKNDS